MLNRGKNLRLFRHPLLEAASHVHPAVPASLYGPLVCYLLIRSAAQGVAPSRLVADFLYGIVIWSLAEYLIHRIVFHFAPRGTRQERLMFIIHGIHHEDPNDATRLVMPPAISLLLALIVYPACGLCAGWDNGPIFFAGITTGYLWYDYTHFFIHHRKPRSRWGHYIRRHHLRHHYASAGINFGVSNPAWDVIFRTAEKRKASCAES